MLSRLVEATYNVADRFHARKIRGFYASRDLGFAIDVGAHKGEFINLVVDRDVPLFVFEPQTSVHEALEAAIADHDVRAFHRAAVSDAAGEIDLYINALSSTTSILPPNEKSAWIRFKKAVLGGELVKGVETVAVTTLDEAVLQSLDGLERGLLKIDVEGNEGRVLAGAQALLTSGKVEFVQIESARYQIYDGVADDPGEILARCGYEEHRRFLFPLLNFSDVIYRRSAE